MVDIAPFRALRHFTKKKQDNISTFICPPYDVISYQQRAELVRRNPANVVQLELPEGNGDKYENAARIMRLWKEEGTIQSDRLPSFYLLETSFRVKDAFAPSKALKRYGVLAALRLETPGKGRVHPHERTLPKAKEDRLHLLAALQTNVSPIFGLFFDPQKKWKKWAARASKGQPLAVGREDKNLSHRMWKIGDEKLQRELRSLLKSKDLYIADGHHRYEVAWAYRESRLAGQPSAELNCLGWCHAMTYICPMEEPGLLMLPTHRLVRAQANPAAWKSHLESVFHLTPVKNLAAAVKILSKPTKTRTMAWAHKGGVFLLTLKPGLSLDRCLHHRPEALRALDVVMLHDLALDEGSEDTGFLKEKEVIYTRDLEEIGERVSRDEGWVAFLLASAGVQSLARVAAAKEVMPPKTTYFYPKVPTGFALMPLKQKIE